MKSQLIQRYRVDDGRGIQCDPRSNQDESLDRLISKGICLSCKNVLVNEEGKEEKKVEIFFLHAPGFVLRDYKLDESLKETLRINGSQTNGSFWHDFQNDVLVVTTGEEVAKRVASILKGMKMR